MIVVKYEIEMPSFPKEILENFKNSWFSKVYKIPLKNNFLDLQNIKLISETEIIIIFGDYIRYLSDVLSEELFKICHFELIFITNNTNIKEKIKLDGLKNNLIYLKFTLINGVYDFSYQDLENVKTINFKTTDYKK